MARAKRTATAAPASATGTIPGLGHAGDVAAEWKPIGWVRPWADNPRLNDSTVPDVAESMRRHGFGAPLVCRSDGTLIAGHTRLKAALLLELPVVPVRVMDHLSVEQAEELALADNRLGERSVWEPNALAKVLERLSASARAAAGFTARQSDKIIAALKDAQLRAGKGLEDDEAPEASEQLRAKWGVALGQLWAVGASRIICGDSTVSADVGRVVGDERPVLMNTDPPYGVSLDDAKKGFKGFTSIAKNGAIKNDDLRDAALQAFLERMVRAAFEHLVENAAVYLWHAHLTQGFFAAAAAAAAADIVLHRQIIWLKPQMQLTRSGQYHWKHEPAFYGWKRGHKPAWYGDAKQTSVWQVGRDGDKGMHPTQKPLELFTRPILNHTKAGEWCYEPFSGSGSQVIAAELSGRRCAALELDPRYVAVLLERASKRGIVCHRIEG